MEILLSKRVVRELAKIYKTDKKLYIKIKKQLGTFQKDPQHPSLRLHKLSGKMNGDYSISITMSIRMVYTQTAGKAYFIYIGTHEEVYRT